MASPVERRQGIFRRSRLLLLLLTVCTVLLLLSFAHISRTPTSRSSCWRQTYLPAFLQDLDQQEDYYGPPVGVRPVPANDTAAADCTWAAVDVRSTRMIRERAGPAFPLLSAWLKPEAARYGPALRSIPPTLVDQFTLGGRVRYEEFFFDQAYLGGDALQSVWTVEEVDRYREQVRQRASGFTYDNAPLYEALDRWGDVAVKGKRGLVIGSETPWLEAMLLEYGAAHVSTLEFGAIRTAHPQLRTYTPQAFTLRVLQGAEDVRAFDFVFTYSSLEHDGLGRYGDVLNPIGDLQSMARMLSVVKPGGFMFLGVPCCEDALYWNAHRSYGPLRLSEMFAGWRTLGSAPREAMEGPRGRRGDWAFQPVWALQNRLGCKGGIQSSDLKKVVEALT